MIIARLFVICRAWLNSRSQLLVWTDMWRKSFHPLTHLQHVRSFCATKQTILVPGAHSSTEKMMMSVLPEGPCVRWTDSGLHCLPIGRRWRPKDATYCLTGLQTTYVPTGNRTRDLKITRYYFDHEGPLQIWIYFMALRNLWLRLRYGKGKDALRSRPGQDLIWKCDRGKTMGKPQWRWSAVEIEPETSRMRIQRFTTDLRPLGPSSSSYKSYIT